MSRGPGTWQRQIMHVTSGTVVATVSGIVRATVVAPDRDDFTAARRGAKGLALAQRVCAVYCHTCTRCGRIQDSDDPVACCSVVRPMLAVCQPERRRLLLHPAPAPGGSCPPWVNVAIMPPRPQGQLPVPGVADLASLALRRAFERLESGGAVSLHDVAGLLRLQREIEREAAGRDARQCRPVAGNAAGGALGRPQAPGRALGAVRRRHPRQSAPRGYVGAPSAKASWGWYESVSQMPWRVQTFWLARQADRKTAAGDLGCQRQDRPAT